MIESILVGRSWIQAIPMRRPFYDTEWLAPGERTLRFFQNPAAFASMARGSKQRGRDTNMMSLSLCPKGVRFYLERIVIYPVVENLDTWDWLRKHVERYRQSASMNLNFLGHIRNEWPMRDVCANILPPERPPEPTSDEKPKPEDLVFDPTEAIEHSCRRGLDVCVAGQPYMIVEQEHIEIKLEGEPIDVEIGFCCYLIGTRLQGIQQ